MKKLTQTINSEIAKSNKNLKYTVRLICGISSITLFVLYVLFDNDKAHMDYTSLQKAGAFLFHCIPHFFVGLIAVPITYYVLTRQGIDPSENLLKEINENNKLAFNDIEANNKIIFNELSETIKNHKVEIDLLKKELEVEKKLVGLIRNRKDKTHNLILRLSRTNTFTKEMGLDILGNYFKDFDIKENGFYINSEYFSLYVYLLRTDIK